MIFLTSSGSVASSLVETVVRGLTAPFGHGVWTGILGAMLFRKSAPTQVRITIPVLSVYPFVSVLHGLWDGLPRVTYISLPAGFDISAVSLVISVVGIATLIVLFRQGLKQRFQQGESTP